MSLAEPPTRSDANTTPYGDAFFDAIEEGSLASARAIVPLVCDLTACRSVVDVGCGRGAWLSQFHDQGAERIAGYDGHYVDRSRLLIPADCFHPVDIARDFSIPTQFDLAICLEVGEHLPKSRAAGLVRQLVSAAPAVLFSAALPGQGGTHHINEQWPSFWQRHFATHSFERLDPFRHLIWRDPAVKWWYKQNLFLFVHASYLAKSSRLLQEQQLAQQDQLHLVHEDVLERKASLRVLARQLWKSLLTRTSRS